MVLVATMHGTAALSNGNLVAPDLRNGLPETAVTQFINGSPK